MYIATPFLCIPSLRLKNKYIRILGEVKMSQNKAICAGLSMTEVPCNTLSMYLSVHWVAVIPGNDTSWQGRPVTMCVIAKFPSVKLQGKGITNY